MAGGGRAKSLVFRKSARPGKHSLGASTDAELGKGIVDFKRILASIDDIDEKLLYVEQETYPGAPLDSARRDYAYITGLTF